MTTLEQRIERVTKGEWRDWKKEYALPKPDGSFVDEGELYWWAGEMEAIIEALQQRLKEMEEELNRHRKVVRMYQEANRLAEHKE